MATNDDTDLKSRAGDAYETARDRTASAYEAARERASGATRRAGEQLSEYPVGAVIGGFAVGALLGAVLPASRREAELFGDVGHRLTDAARDAARTAAEAGREQIDEITGNAVTKVGGAVVDAVSGKQ